ncbi:LBL_2463 family protein [Leptospira yasudae]|uniref:GNAT family N-acetyltransferase n=1 Tax=Leptospira yasudae TaxID=2202201 RepID=A0A6N4R1D4_9LEPT|nr:hypothetical protein [Leptospira yasudae]TGL81447.1 hypothetical protein EHQ72_05905 [Leptospira yasudae]TGL81710.1 hypothetical protein EHQ77_06455 [Leptospira yasudae]TGL88086.1 hypothetical protein EHQ83_03815 [Leptospira yasudae]
MSQLILERSQNKPRKEKLSLFEHTIVGLENPYELLKVKEFIRSVFTAYGYDKSAYTSVDLDPWSTWFYVSDETGKILSAMRVVEKKPNNYIPIEMAVIEGSEPQMRYAIIEENVADWNNVAFANSYSGWKAARRNFIMVARHCIWKNYNKVYGFYDPTMRAIVRIYTAAGAELSKRFDKLVFFPGSLLNNVPVKLNIIEIPKASLQKIASKIT